MLPEIESTPIEELLRKMRAADKDPRAHWLRVKARIERGEIRSLYAINACEQALAQLREREPGEEG